MFHVEILCKLFDFLQLLRHLIQLLLLTDDRLHLLFDQQVLCDPVVRVY